MIRIVSTFLTPAGPFSIALDAAGALVAATFGGVESLPRPRGGTLREDAAPAAMLRAQVMEYFAGRRTRFDVPLAAGGSSFQRRIWTALGQIPYGETRSYGELARELGTSPRAIGRANGSNPICLIVPCHRVIGTDGSLTGYAGGLAVKQLLLDHEARHMTRGAAGGPASAAGTARSCATAPGREDRPR